MTDKPTSTRPQENSRPAVDGRWQASFVHPLLPAMDEFLEGLGRGRIIGLACRDCSKVTVQPRVRCLFCQARLGDIVTEVGPGGIIRSVCVVTTPMGGLEDPPGAVACVQPEGADSALLARLRGAETLEDDALTALVGQPCRLRPPTSPSRTWGDLEFELSEKLW